MSLNTVLYVLISDHFTNLFSNLSENGGLFKIYKVNLLGILIFHFQGWSTFWTNKTSTDNNNTLGSFSSFFNGLLIVMGSKNKNILKVNTSNSRSEWCGTSGNAKFVIVLQLGNINNFSILQVLFRLIVIRTFLVH